MRHLFSLAAALAAATSIPALAAETTTYRYDAKGRLIRVEQAGGPRSGAVSSYAFDKADNRTEATVTGVPPMVVVVPLNGFQVIVLTPPG